MRRDGYIECKAGDEFKAADSAKQKERMWATPGGEFMLQFSSISLDCRFVAGEESGILSTIGELFRYGETWQLLALKAKVDGDSPGTSVK